MLAVLRNHTYAKLFSAQVIALIGTGLLTVALGLLAFDIAGGDAGVVLGTALTIKMVAYVGVSPVLAAATARLEKKPVLIIADVLRALVAGCLPFVSEAWQIYVLIFVLQACSATFTPAFQAVIPSVLPEERDYTRALSLSRLAYDLESLLSPVLAAALLGLVSYHHLFLGTTFGFVISAALVIATRLPSVDLVASSAFLTRLGLGVRVFRASRELRGLMAMNLVVAASTAMVLVNTVVIVQGELGRAESDVAVMLAAAGAGSMLVALALPKLLESLDDRRVMLTGSAMIPIALAAAAGLLMISPGPGQWWGLLMLWALMGAGQSAILTPSARLVRRNTTEADRPAAFAAQFSLSHACFLLTYPVAGLFGAHVGLAGTALILAAVGLIGAVAATRIGLEESRSTG